MLSSRTLWRTAACAALAAVVGCGGGEGSTPSAPTSEKDSAKIVPAEVTPSRAVSGKKKPATPVTAEP